MSPHNSTAVTGTAGGPESRQHAAPRGARTTNERAREQMLVEDKMVTILTPQLVLCNCCGTEIKLSKKSLFDTFHWYQHRERCLKRHGDEFNERKMKPCRPVETWPVATKVQARKNHYVRPTTPSPPPIVKTPSTASSEASLPLSPLSPLSSLSTGSTFYTSETYELSTRAFERVQQWTLRGINGYPSHCHSLGEPYDSQSPRSHITFEESQIRGTYH